MCERTSVRRTRDDDQGPRQGLTRGWTRRVQARAAGHAPRTLAGALVVLLLASASVSAFPWIRDMWVGPVVLPGTLPLVPPEDVLSVDGQPVMNRIDARDKLRNPRTPSRQVAEEGAELYRIYCATCHGEDGQGDGPVASHFRRMPDLTATNVQNYADGWIYSIIRDGGFNMPPLGASLSVDERWAVVHHVRSLNPAP